MMMMKRRRRRRRKAHGRSHLAEENAVGGVVHWKGGGGRSRLKFSVDKGRALDEGLVLDPLPEREGCRC